MSKRLFLVSVIFAVTFITIGNLHANNSPYWRLNAGHKKLPVRVDLPLKYKHPKIVRHQNCYDLNEDGWISPHEMKKINRNPKLCKRKAKR